MSPKKPYRIQHHFLKYDSKVNELTLDLNDHPFISHLTYLMDDEEIYVVGKTKTVRFVYEFTLSDESRMFVPDTALGFPLVMSLVIIPKRK